MSINFNLDDRDVLVVMPDPLDHEDEDREQFEEEEDYRHEQELDSYFYPSEPSE